MRPAVLVLVADAVEARRDALVSVLAAEPDLEVVTPAATLGEVTASQDGVDVVVLVGDLGCGAVEVLEQARREAAHSPRRGVGPQAAGQQNEGGRDRAAWVVLTEERRRVDEILAAGAHGCLVVSSTPVQIGAAVRAAARGERADLDQPVTGPLVQRTPRTAPPLTDREVEILRLVGAGLGNQQIAERLYLSRSSVKSHLSHTYGRLGVTRRSAAVAEARRQGLI